MQSESWHFDQKSIFWVIALADWNNKDNSNSEGSYIFLSTIYDKSFIISITSNQKLLST